METEFNLLAEAEGEGDTGLVLADGGGAVLDAEFAQYGNDRRNERLADNKVGPAAIVKDGDIHPFHREETGQGRARRPAANNSDRFNLLLHLWILPLGVSGTLSTSLNSTGTL